MVLSFASLLFNDSVLSPGLDSLSESWNSSFNTSSKDPKKSINLREVSLGNNDVKDNNSRWFYVRDKNDSIVANSKVKTGFSI